MSKQIQTKLYELLYSWTVTEFCDDCQTLLPIGITTIGILALNASRGIDSRLPTISRKT